MTMVPSHGEVPKGPVAFSKGFMALLGYSFQDMRKTIQSIGGSLTAVTS